MSIIEVYNRGINRAQIVDGVMQCGPDPENIIQEIAGMQTLFVAKIVSQKPILVPHGEYDTITTASVDENLFGGIEAGDLIEIHHSKQSSVGIDFAIGSRPLISAYVEFDESGPFRISTDSCIDPFYTVEEYREALNGDICVSQDQSQSTDFEPIGLKLVVLDEDGEITADEDRERLVMRINSNTTRVTEYWRG